jgi:protein-S-isoprenylcysteine O-methyltransferase Ste14
MGRSPVTFEGKGIDHAFAIVFLVMGIGPIISVLLDGQLGLEQIEALASVPLAFMACYSFIVRSEVKVPAYSDEILVPLLSYLSPLVLLNLTMFTSARYSFPWFVLLSVAGLILALLSFWSLRRSFAVLPSVRAIVSQGPYRWVRHPLYLGEATFILGMMMLAFNLLSLLVYGIFIALMLARIRMEERKLFTQEEYRLYASSVKYRMIPYVY